MKFRNRKEAGEKLAEALDEFDNDKNAVVVAIPRGGVATGRAISNRLNLPLEVVLVKKIGHPSNPEFAIGAVSLKNQILKPNTDIQEEFVQTETQKIRSLLAKRTALFYGTKKPLSLQNRNVIIVDDGIATGNTVKAAIDLIRKENPKQIIVATPVAPIDTINEIEKYADKVVCLETPYPFYAIGSFYQEFDQLSDEEAIKLFKE